MPSRPVNPQYPRASKVNKADNMKPATAENLPSDLEGEVTAIAGQDVIEISLGFDDGIRKGQKFSVVRPNTGKYVGDIEVISANYPNRAVCRVDKAMQRDQLQKGDRVAVSTDNKTAKPPKKPLESWKPARVVPNCSRLMVGDKEQLPLKGMQVDVRVDGFRARVLLDLYYLNDRPQQLEGNFQLRLPDEAAPYFFAFGRTVYQAPQPVVNESMFFKPQEVSLGDTTPEKILALRGNSWEQPKVARMVPKEKAAMAYRDTVRRRIDPALVEWSGAGVFQCRVFPLAPQSLHRVTIGYDVDLVRVGDDLELRLDLPDSQSDEPGPPQLSISMSRQPTPGRSASIRPRRNRRAAGLSYRLVDPKDRPLMVRLRKPGTVMLTGNDDATGSYFATRVTLPLAEDKALAPGPSPKGRGEETRPAQAIFLVDTSLSAGPQFRLWTKMLRATLENNRDQIKEFAVLFFNVETFWWQEKYVPNTPENVEAADELRRQPGLGRRDRSRPGLAGSGRAAMAKGRWRSPRRTCSS